MNLPKFPHSAMFVGVMACGKTEFLLRLLETIYKNHFEFIVIFCPTILGTDHYFLLGGYHFWDLQTIFFKSNAFQTFFFITFCNGNNFFYNHF